MHYRPILKAGLNISEIAFGCGGNAGLMVRGARDEQIRAIARALELGVNYFDNSPDYGDCAAEINLGAALKALCARPMVNTKVEIRAADCIDVASHVVRSAEESLRRLGIDAIDVLQIHNGPTRKPIILKGRDYRQLPLDSYLGPKGAVEGLARLKQAGKVLNTGFICRGDDGAEVRELIETGLFDVINVPYTLLNPSAARTTQGAHFAPDYGAVIGYARARGVGVAIYAPLAGGFLSDTGVAGATAHPYSRAPKANDETLRNRSKAAAVRFVAEATGMSLAQAAYRFILMNEGVTTALGGFSSIQQMEEIAAISGAPPIPPDVMTRLEETWRTNFGSGP